MALQNYNMNDILLAVVGITGAFSALCLTIQKSKCKKLKICFGCINCDRDTQAIVEEERLRITGHKGTTPRPTIQPEPETESIFAQT